MLWNGAIIYLIGVLNVKRCKITNQQLKYAISLLNKNEQITMKELSIQVNRRYKKFNITSQHLGKVIRDNNITRKRTKHKYYPKIRN